MTFMTQFFPMAETNIWVATKRMVPALLEDTVPASLVDL